MTEPGFLEQMRGYGQTTAEIHFFRPEAPSLLRLSVSHEFDLAPDFPVVFEFIDRWRREIDAALHSVRIAGDRLTRLTEWSAVDGVTEIL